MRATVIAERIGWERSIAVLQASRCLTACRSGGREGPHMADLKHEYRRSKFCGPQI